MPKFAVTIEGRIRKTLDIEADTEADAIEQAHTEFTVANEEGVPEDYNEDLVCVKEVD